MVGRHTEADMAQLILLRGARVFDGVSAEIRVQDVLVEGDRIVDVGQIAPSNGDLKVVETAGAFLMPGLIDAHVHVCGAELSIQRTTSSHWSYLSAFGFNTMNRRLLSGFTTLRDMGGANIGMARALREGLVIGPRLFYSGKLMSQTGGHGDARSPDYDLGSCCGGSDKFAWVVDGVAAVRRAVREELRLGAHQIKIMASGGILSAADPLHSVQFSESEILAAVEEAANHGTYVSAHCHPAAAIRRCANLGVRVIEHATMMDEPAAEALAANKTYTVPTLAILAGLMQQGEALGLPPENMDKLRQVAACAQDSLRLLRRSGIPIGFGTDLFGKTHGLDHTEFRLRAAVEAPLDILRSATSVNAEILQKSGELGVIAKGALADIILVEGDPTQDIAVLEDGDNVSLVMQGGIVRKDLRARAPRS